MVRTVEQPPVARAAPIAGGFVLIPVARLLAAWFACRDPGLGAGEFRCFLACHELVARRHRPRDGMAPSYDYPELARLLGVKVPRARRLVARLVAAGLLAWSDTAITFPNPSPVPEERLGPFADTIGRGKGDLAIPRRVLRFLARGSRPARIAVVLGALLRCLSSRRDQVDGWGRFKATWIARAFGVGEREVKAARKELVALGWIAPEGDNRQHQLNRWGPAYRIDLDWMPPTASMSRSTPPPAATMSRSAPLLYDQDPLREENQDQDPAPGGPTGVQITRDGTGNRKPSQSEPVLTPTPTIGGAIPASAWPGPSSPPQLRDVTVEDLQDTGRTLALMAQAVTRGWVGDNEADRLRVVAAAEHARSDGTRNPAGLFVHLVQGRRWGNLTAADEDRANARLKADLRGPGSGPARPAPGGSAARGTALSEDARLVRSVKEEYSRRGHRADPFPALRARDPGWTRERWDRAELELVAARAVPDHQGGYSLAGSLTKFFKGLGNGLTM